MVVVDMDIPEWLKHTHENQKPVVCDKCGVTFFLDYKEARRRLEKDDLRIKHRQVRTPDTIAMKGKWESEPYMAGLCDACAVGLQKPSVEWETQEIGRRVRHFLRVGVDPENATSYATAEYARKYNETYLPVFHEWWESVGWQTRPEPALPKDWDWPLTWLGTEPGYGNGSVFCPHVDNEQAQDWDRRIA
jgi:hypothetical protein